MEENQQKEAKEHILPVDPPRELVLKLQKLNRKCLHQRSQNLKEPKQVVKESHIHTKEEKHEENITISSKKKLEKASKAHAGQAKTLEN